MVVKREILFSNGSYFEGFKEHSDETDFIRKILQNQEWHERDLMETNPEYKQPIGYVIVLNPRTKKVLLYQRSKKKENVTEARLRGKFSFGFGGHVDLQDKELNEANPIEASVRRELEEELGTSNFNLKLIGYINYDKTPVSSVHFGLLYIAETEKDIIPKGKEIHFSKMATVDELRHVCENADMEDWSVISLEPVKAYLERL